MIRRLAGLPAAYRKRPAPALAALALAAVLVAAVGVWYVVRAGTTDPAPARVETSQSACPSPPPGYTACDPIPPANETGFQTGDKG